MKARHRMRQKQMQLSGTNGQHAKVGFPLTPWFILIGRCHLTIHTHPSYHTKDVQLLTQSDIVPLN